MQPSEQNNTQPNLNLRNPSSAAYAAQQPAADTPPVAAPQANASPPQQQKIPVKPGANPNSTQNNLQIAEVRDGIVIMNDGSFRSVAMFKSINFDLMSPSEQESVEAGYQSFLNSLYFPIQIFVRSEKVDMQPYIERLQKIQTEHDNMLLAILMNDYLDYIGQLSEQTNIMDKHFYVVIPFLPSEAKQKPLTSSKNILDGVLNLFSKNQTHVVINEAKLEEAKTELRNRVQVVLNGLMQCGVKGLPLDTQELIELFYGAYNPDTATRQQLRDFKELTTPIVTKGEGQAPQPSLERELQA